MDLRARRHEDPHLALVESHIWPSRHAFSVGTSMPAVGSGVYLFVPQDDGVYNRLFADVTSDGTMCGYIPEWP
ncbi:hypothetical protein KKA85_11970, partial [bacterium]|nr:hypothetical protein [bacterium]